MQFFAATWVILLGARCGTANSASSSCRSGAARKKCIHERIEAQTSSEDIGPASQKVDGAIFFQSDQAMVPRKGANFEDAFAELEDEFDIEGGAAPSAVPEDAAPLAWENIAVAEWSTPRPWKEWLPAKDSFALTCMEFIVCGFGVSAFLFWRGTSKPRHREDRRPPATELVGDEQRFTLENDAVADDMTSSSFSGAVNAAGPRAHECWNGESPLHVAALSDVAACRTLLLRRADVNAVDDEGDTPLVSAARAGNEDICTFLMDHGGGMADLADEQLPPLLSDLLLRRIMA